MLRKGSSVAFRAPCNFGYKDVGGSSPSPSTNLSAGSSSGYRKLFQVSDHSLIQLGISRALRTRKQGNTIKLIVSKLLERLGGVVGSNPASRTNGRLAYIGNATIYGNQMKVMRLVMSNLVKVFGLTRFNSSPAHQFYANIRKGSSVVRASHSFGYENVGGSNPSPSTKLTAYVVQPYL